MSHTLIFIRQIGATCSSGSGFSLNIPTWYKYLECVDNNPQIGSLSDVWKIAVAILEIIIYFGGIAAVFFVIFGGIQFITSNGQPDKVAQARNTIVSAIAGLIIAILATVVVRFIASGFGVEEQIINQNL